MTYLPLCLAALAAPLSGYGCGAFSPLLPDARTPADRAHQLDARCKGGGEERVAAIFAPSTVDSVAPSYSYVQSGNDRAVRLRGAEIHLRPLAGFARESLARDLECHEARVVLGAAAPRADDPFVLPGRWVEIDVNSEGDGFVVLARVDEIDSARELLARAQRTYRSPAP